MTLTHHAGNVTGGYGGNYNDVHSRPLAHHWTSYGCMSARRDDLFLLEGSRELISMCYAFEYIRTSELLAHAHVLMLWNLFCAHA